MNKFEKNFLIVLIALAVLLSAACFFLQKKSEVHLKLVRDEVYAKTV